MNTTKEIKKNPLGYYELVNKPTQAELEEFYNQQYFDSKNFEIKYSDEEFFHKKISFFEALEISNCKKGRFLDIGCGEGFSLDFFSTLDWQVLGLDYSRDGVSRHFPKQVENLKVGDLYKSLDELQANGEKFDLIVCNNVLEHLLDPIDFFKRFNDLLSSTGIARIQVPNDNSYLQKRAVEKKLAPDSFWIAPTEHMSYFTQDSLKSLAEHCGLRVVDVLGDFPIDFFLFNENSNYLKNSQAGAACHKARIQLDNLMCEEDVSKLVAFRRGCGQAGLGRNAVIYIGLKND